MCGYVKCISCFRMQFVADRLQFRTFFYLNFCFVELLLSFKGSFYFAVIWKLLLIIILGSCGLLIFEKKLQLFFVLHCFASTILFLRHNALVIWQLNWLYFADVIHTLFSWPQTKDVLHSDTGHVLGTAAIIYINHLEGFAFCCILLHGCQRTSLTSCASSLETCWPVSLHFLPHLCKLTKTCPVLYVNKAQQVEEGT